MNKNIIISSSFHVILIFIATLSLPFLAKKPIDLPPIVSVELIQITDKTNIPFAPKAKKTIEKIKEDKQNPEKIDNEVKQVSEFEKDELFDPNNIAALIDKSKIEIKTRWISY